MLQCKARTMKSITRIVNETNRLSLESCRFRRRSINNSLSANEKPVKHVKSDYHVVWKSEYTALKAWSDNESPAFPQTSFTRYLHFHFWRSIGSAILSVPLVNHAVPDRKTFRQRWLAVNIRCRLWFNLRSAIDPREIAAWGLSNTHQHISFISFKIEHQH